MRARSRCPRDASPRSLSIEDHWRHGKPTSAQYLERRAAVLKNASKGDKSHSKPTFRRGSRTTHASTTAPRMEAAALKSGPRIHRAGRAAAKAVQGDKSHFQFRRAAPPKERQGDRRVPLQPSQKEISRRAHHPRISHLIACNHSECNPVTHPRLVTLSPHSLSCDSPGRPPSRAVVVRHRLCGSLRPRLQQLGRRWLLGGAGEAGNRSTQRRSSP